MTRILIFILLASLAVTAAGCGSKPTSSGVAQLPSATTTTSTQNGDSPTSGSSKRGDAAYRYSACMRKSGVPKFPDPQPSSGGGMSLTMGPGTGIDPKSPQFQAAEKACKELLPNGGKVSPAMQAKALAQMLKFSACMRAHGLPDFPDPTTSAGGGIQLSIGGKKGSGLNPSSPIFQAAQKACQSVMPGPPVKGGGSTELHQGGPSTGSVGAP